MKFFKIIPSPRLLFFLALLTFGPAPLAHAHLAIECAEAFSDVIPAVSAPAPFGSFETARTKIRPSVAEDLAPVSAILMDRRNQQMSGDYMGIGMVEQLVSPSAPIPAKYWSRLSFTVLAKTTGEVIGFIQVSKVENQPALRAQAQRHGTGSQGDEIASQWATLGSSLSASHWGEGLMTEIIQSTIRYGYSHLEVSQFFGETRQTNLGAQRVLQKSGFRQMSAAGNMFYYELPGGAEAILARPFVTHSE